MRREKKVGIIIFITLMCFNVSKGQLIKYSKENIEIFNARGEKIKLDTTTFDGEHCIQLNNNAIANINTNVYTNFELEVDMFGAGMAGIGFHSKDLFNYEFLYFRAGFQSTLQYVPLYNGATGWQLYNPPLYEKNIDFPENKWVHVTLVVENKTLKVYLNDSKAPEIIIDLLRDDLDSGNILLKSEFNTFYYANLKIKEIETKETKQLPQKKNNDYNTTWEVSSPFDLNEGFMFWETKTFLTTIQGWDQIHGDKNGLINLSKFIEVPKGTIAVKTNFKADTELTKRLLYDYTHSIAIILNSKVVFCGKEFDNYGYVNDGEESLDLMLNKGNNELIFIVTSDYGLYGDGILYQGRKQAANWGFIARLENYEGIKLENHME